MVFHYPVVMLIGNNPISDVGEMLHHQRGDRSLLVDVRDVFGAHCLVGFVLGVYGVCYCG